MRFLRTILFGTTVLVSCLSCAGTVPTVVSPTEVTRASTATTEVVPTAGAPVTSTPLTTATTLPPPPAPALAPSTTSTSEPHGADPCAAVDFRNESFDLPDYLHIELSDGEANRGRPEDPGHVYMSVRDVVVGDVGGDAQPETIMLTNSETQGEGRFTNVYVFTCEDDVPFLLASAPVGDRAYGGVRSVAVVQGRLLIDRYADDRGACCASSVARTAFVLRDDALVQFGQPAIRKLLNLNGTQPMSLTFLTDSLSTVVEGTTGRAQPVGTSAFGHQKLTVVVSPAAPGQPQAVVEVLHNDTVIGAASSGTGIAVDTPEDGYYVIRAKRDPTGSDTPFAAEISLTAA